MISKKIRDYILGTVLAVIFCLLVGKLLHPDMSIVDIFKLIVRSQVGWSW